MDTETRAPDERDALAARLRAVGLRATGPRLTILGVLAGDRRHPTAEMVHQSLRRGHPSLSLSTVYQTLEAFRRTGLVRRVGTAGGSSRVDGTSQDHDHAVCRQCGRVFDVDRGHFERSSTPAALPNGLRVEKVFVEYEVVCADCEGDA
jgi:Fe2+ or Zn2+ uptake regulation protein